jgi:hypothetical protein
MHTLFGVLVAALAFVALADSARAAPRECGNCGMFGLARGQVARINVLHVGDRDQRPIQVEMLFFDSTDTVVGRDVQTVSFGQAASLEQPFDGGRGEDRIELRAVVNSSDPSESDENLRITVEVFDAATGETTLFLSDTDS